MKNNVDKNQWLGKIPDSWNLIKGRYLFSQRVERGNSVELQLLSPTQKYGVIPQALYEKLSGTSAVKLDEKTKLNMLKTIHKGDFCISLRSFQGGFEYSEYEGVCSPAYQVFYPIHSVDRQYYKYLFKDQCFIDKMNSYTLSLRDGKNIAFADFGNTYLPVPPIKEQKKISNLLNKKCMEIEALYSDIEKQIETLEEYKKSIITEAVTKGLDPDVEMKDSGIEWIGMIPKHWKVTNLKYLGKCQNGISKGGEYFGNGFPFVSYGDVYKNYSLPLNVDGLIISTKTEQNIYSVKYGDVFFTRTSETIEEIGFASTCLKSIDNSVFAGFLIRFRPTSNDLAPEFSKFYFRSNIHRKFFVKEMNLVTRASLSQELLKNLPVLLPPIKEQKQIANFLDEKCLKIDTLIEKKEKFIKELETYKQSIIYEYVTGKKEVL